MGSTWERTAVGSWIGLLIGVIVAYWIIRSAVFGGMRDFAKWKREEDAGPSRQDARYDQYDQYDQYDGGEGA